MKKLYIYLVAFSATGLFAQKNIVRNENGLSDRNYVQKQKVSHEIQNKAQGDTLWMNDFETASEWTQTFGPNHYLSTASFPNPGWELVTSIPSNITSQQSSYQWPSSFTGATGQFALINSDLAGEGNAQQGVTVVQDAYFAFNQNIDLSSAGNTPLYLSFSEYYRNFYDGTFVEISLDGGATWTTFEANPEVEVPVNTNCAPGETEVINITPAIGSGNWTNQVRIRFHYTGQWDWFWGIDDVKIVEAWENDIKAISWYAATDVASTLGLDYYTVDNSQTSFPGLTFGSIIYNNGSAFQDSVAINAIATGGYNQTGSYISLDANGTDSVSIASPYIPTGTGLKTIDLTTVINGTDAVLDNNTASMTLTMSNTEYSRDNGTITGSISNVSNNPSAGGELGIGNIMEIFNDWTTTGASVYLPTQSAAAVGAEYNIIIAKWDGTEYVFLAETETRTINSTTATWSSINWIGGPLTLNAGDDILLLAAHQGGVRFGIAQNTFEGTVLGFTGFVFDWANSFSLSSPGAIMVRLTDDPIANVDENLNSFGLEVAPNPAADATSVTFTVKNTSDAIINVVDMAGKIVSTQTLSGVNGTQAVEINTSALNSGLYTVNVTANGTSVSEKLAIRK